jgi:hypothetical protein
MADRKGTLQMRKKLIALSIALLAIGGSLTFTTSAARADFNLSWNVAAGACGDGCEGLGLIALDSSGAVVYVAPRDGSNFFIQQTMDILLNPYSHKYRGD